MKKSLMIIFGLMLLVTACKSSNSVVYDDAYYSPYDAYSHSMNGTLVTSSGGNIGSSALRNNESYDYSEYYPADSTAAKTDTVYVIEETTPRVTVEFGVGFGWPYYGWGPYYWGPYYMPSWYFGWGYDPWYGTYWYGSYWRPWGPMHPWYTCCCCHPVYYASTYYKTWDRPHSYQYRSANNGGIANVRNRNASSGLQVASNARRSNSASETPRQTDVRPGASGVSARPSATASGSRPTASSRPSASATRPAAVRTGQNATGARPTQSTRPSTGLRPTQATRPSASARATADRPQATGRAAQSSSINNRQMRSGSEYVRPQNSTISRTSTSRTSNSSRNSIPTTTTTRSSSSTRSFGNISSGSTRSGSSSGSYSGGYSGGARSGGSFGGGSVGGGRSGGGGRR